MNSMVNQMEGMIGTVSSIGSNTGLEINDVSRDDTAEDIIGKAYNCINYGEVAGETAVGGIAGMLNNEIIMSEEDVERVMQWPRAMVGTDGQYAPGTAGGHPRSFATFP